MSSPFPPAAVTTPVTTPTPVPPAAAAALPGRADYPHFLAIATRWMDNDVYGHVNNVVYYSYFDTVINEYLIRAGALDIHQGEAIGYCAESQCRYLAPLAFPETIEAGLRVVHLGKSSVRYEIALFRQGEAAPAAVGWFVHVFVGREGNRPTPIPPGVRASLQRLMA
ncbi:MAG: thioesterase family protein [Sulfuritalea sp.]|nr:thioesterase family protein [Sulfuritalea sp.]